MGLAHAGQTYENICANPADYDGNAQYLSDGNCSTAIGSKNVWSNINWTTVTGEAISSNQSQEVEKTNGRSLLSRGFLDRKRENVIHFDLMKTCR